MCQLSCFFEYRAGKAVEITNDQFMSNISECISKLSYEKGEFHGIEEFIVVQNKMKEITMVSIMEEFTKFCDDMSQKFDTFKFWNRFLKEDVLSYINLYVAIRERNWDLRMAAFKSMAPLFHAFDRHNYSRLIPMHISTMNALPPYVLEHFKNGAFASSIKGTNYATVALDEGHEMLINRDGKMSLAHSLPKHMDQLVGTIEYQAQLLRTLEDQLGINNSNKLHRDLQWSVIQSEFNNVKLYYDNVSKTSMFQPVQDPNLIHVVSKVTATPVQQKSLLSYREIGNDSYESYCKSQILNDTSVKKPVKRKFQLKTFAREKLRRKKVTDLEKEKKLIARCYKRTIAFSQETQTPISELCQFSEYPRAICNQDGLPHKGAKSVIYDFFNKKYSSTYEIVSSSFKFVSSTCVIVEGMNIIYSSPLKNLKTFAEYAQFLVARWVLPFFRKGVQEVRILFDQVGTQGISPKDVERSRRDRTEEECDCFDSIDDGVPLPSQWSSFLKVRQNKHALCRFLSNKFIDLVKDEIIINSGQVFITSGGFHVGIETSSRWTGVSVSEDGIDHHNIVHNHEESDTQIWLHVYDTPCNNILIYSIDRDIGMIGLPLDFGNKHVTVQYSARAGDEKYLDLNSLQSACDHDSDLASLFSKQLNARKTLQVLYICSGCDFVSYFAHIGKTTFLKIFFQHAHFITGGYSNTQGHLSETKLNENCDNGLLSFYRLIMCIYYHANRSCLHNFSSIIDVYNSIDVPDALTKHHKALDIIRAASWKGEYEDDLLPSCSALKLHWLRSCWVSSVWDNVCSPYFMYPDVSLYGYNVSTEDDKNKVSLIWDTEENINLIRENVIHLTRGCACSKSKCTNKLCKCVKDNKRCGPGCRCKNCQNVPNSSLLLDDEVPESDDDSYSFISNESTFSNENISSDMEDDYVNFPLGPDGENSDTDFDVEDMDV